MLTHQKHTLKPIFDQDSKVLILGSFPSPKSREIGFYYGHPQNRFWKIMSDIYQITLDTIEQKTTFLYSKHIALWDVIESCEIDGAKDSSIQNVKVNDIASILQQTKIDKIYTTGRKAYNLYQKYLYPILKIKAIYLPSTSPLNASMKYDRLLEIYKQEFIYLKS